MNTVEKIKTIADHYGVNAQSRQCIEECSELIQSLCKFARKVESEEQDGLTECILNIYEELADTQIMVFQLAYLFNVDLTPIIEQKLDRQLRRIEKGIKDE